MWAVRARRGALYASVGHRAASSMRAAPCALRSVLWAPTEKEIPADAAIPSHQLLVRGGFIRKSGHGVFSLLPLGRRVVTRMEAIIDEEMLAIGGNRVDLPVLIPAELWQQSGRWQTRGPELMTLSDRREDVHALAPTHEESVTSLVAAHYNAAETAESLRVYQIGRKFRDEIRPRFGLLRAREFIMKDMYSFDPAFEGALRTYEDVTGAYERILRTRLQLPVARVEADSGNIGGNLSHEFHVLAGIGEDAILSCSSADCDYAANVEKAEGLLPSDASLGVHDGEVSAEVSVILDRLEDPSVNDCQEIWKTILELQQTAGECGFAVTMLQELQEQEDKDENTSPRRLALCFTRQDREANELAVKPFFGGNEGVVVKSSSKMLELLSSDAAELHVLLDDSLKLEAERNPVVKTLCSVVERQVERQEHTTAAWGHFRLAQEGDCCPRCNSGSGVLEAKRGIEVGHVFYLGQKYSKPFGATYTDAKNVKHPLEMGCYGLGVTRLIAAAVEVLHDDHGIIWPAEIAPFKVLVMSIGSKKQEDAISQAAWRVAGDLASGAVAGLVRDDVLLDDRWRESPGSKLAESELIGYPFRVVVGRRFVKEGLVEVQTRATLDKTFLPPDELPAFFAERAQLGEL